MNVRAEKSGRRARKRALVGDGVIAQMERDKDVRQLVAAEVKDRSVDHHAKIALAAYFIAEKRGFEPGHELDDWLAAEAELAQAEQQPRVILSS
jgi:Protein of unknown function (DUF2934).